MTVFGLQNKPNATASLFDGSMHLTLIRVVYNPGDHRPNFYRHNQPRHGYNWCCRRARLRSLILFLLGFQKGKQAFEVVKSVCEMYIGKFEFDSQKSCIAIVAHER